MTDMTTPAQGRRADCSDAEWALRVQLADCYHLVAHFGWTETIFNHISARLPGTGHYLVNPFGLNYEEITPANLLKVDTRGHKVEPSPHDANPAGFALHGCIHEARDDIHCVIHTHTTEVSAIALKEEGFHHDDFYGAQLYGRVGYHAFEGITLFAEERERMLASLGDKHILVLRNHGIAVGEIDIPRAFFLLWTVQRAAEVQCLARSMAGADTRLPASIGQRCADLTQMLIHDNDFADKFFAAMVRRLPADRAR
ncbi:class II aldolase/adducin family protein [Derxia gummosa]|uniref:Class II aldolase/adducin family protein n=1 Tax=Derxia gummosa DSM 723 TaxID=1121388 RepID=A0A8B6X9H6_9BURK|nr:class II aldolase/adducin family protein [Derxia gummosa]